MKRTDPRQIRVGIPIDKNLFECSLDTIIDELTDIKTKYGPDVQLSVESVTHEYDYGYGDCGISAGVNIECWYIRTETADEVKERIQREKTAQNWYKTQVEAKERAQYEELKKKFEKSQ